MLLPCLPSLRPKSQILTFPVTHAGKIKSVIQFRPMRHRKLLGVGVEDRISGKAFTSLQKGKLEEENSWCYSFFLPYLTVRQQNLRLKGKIAKKGREERQKELSSTTLLNCSTLILRLLVLHVFIKF